MYSGGLKGERGIIGAILITFFSVIVTIALLIFAGFLGFKYSGASFELFNMRDYFTVSQFNSELGKLLLIITGLLLGVCVLVLIIINTNVKIRFRKKYLSKTNVYIYDIFLGMLNVLLYTLVGVVFFAIINTYSIKFNGMFREGIIDPEVKLGIIGAYKYIVVVIVALFMSLNAFRGINITYNKNKFVFEDHL